MLCYRCGSHVPDGSSTCPTCGQSFASGSVRQTTGTFSRRKLSTAQIDGSPFKAGDVVAGRYAIRDIIGQGPVGFVFRALDKEVDVEVALKMISPRLLQTADERRAFGRELKGARKLNHPNIARVYEEGEYQDRPFFTMQFLDGLSLRKIIDLRKEKGQYFRPDEVEPILAQIAQALDEAHKAGVVHGDIKPENVLVLPDLLKVTDFSLGMAMPRLPFVNAQKPRRADRYCAPEFAGGEEVSSAIDIYSLGVILGEMLAGVVPEGHDVPEIRRINAAVTPQLEAIYRRAVNGNPQARYTRASAFASEIALAAGGAEVGSTTMPGSRHAVAAALASGRPPTLPPKEGAEPSRRGPIRRPPPPPVAGPATAEVEVTPVGRPPPPLNAARITDEVELERPRPPPPTRDPQAAVDTRQFELPSVLDANGQATEEPTQVMASGPFVPPAPGRAPPLMPIARPLPPRRSNAAIFSLLAVGLLAGVGGGWLILQHDRAEGDRQLAELKRQEAEHKRLLEVEDAGRWERLLSGGEVRDAGPDVALTTLPADAGPAAVAVGTGGTVVPTAVHVGGGTGCPEGTVLIAAGEYLRGFKPGDQLAGWDEVALSKSHTDGYCIDIYEYPNQAGAKPTTGATFAEAKAACEGQQKRLCTEDEWERACKGPQNGRFAYGEKFDPEACNMTKTLAASGDHARCKSGYGVFDISGNAAEWTSSRYTAGASGKAVKGGGSPGDVYARCSGRRPVSERSKEAMLGFRCCRDAN